MSTSRTRTVEQDDTEMPDRQSEQPETPTAPTPSAPATSRQPGTSRQPRPFLTAEEMHQQHRRNQGAEAPVVPTRTYVGTRDRSSRPPNGASHNSPEAVMDDIEAAEILLSLGTQSRNNTASQFTRGEVLDNEGEVFDIEEDNPERIKAEKRKRSGTGGVEASMPLSKRKKSSGKEPAKKAPAKEQPARTQRAKRGGPQKIKGNFSLLAPQDAEPAKRDQPDPSKFTLTVRYEDGPKKGQLKVNRYNEERVETFDWGNAESIKRLNAWRAQIRERHNIVLRSEPRPRWTVTEVELLRLIVAQHMAEVRNRHLLDWEEIARDFNDTLRGRTAWAGEEYAGTIKSAPRPDNFGEPEEDVSTIEEVPYEPFKKDRKKRKGKSKTKQGRQHQTWFVQEDFAYDERGVSAIRSHATLVASIIDELNREFDSDPSSSEDSDEVGDDEEANFSDDVANDADVSLLEDIEDYGEGPSSMNAATPSGTGILNDPNNFVREGMEPDPREEQLYGPRQAAKDRAGPGWHKGG